MLPLSQALPYLLFVVCFNGPWGAAAPPVVTVESFNLQYSYYGDGQNRMDDLEDGPVVVSSALAIADGDSTHLSSATVTISSGFLTGDALAFTAQSGITGSYNSLTGALTLTGSSTLGGYETALRSVMYRTAPDLSFVNIPNSYAKNIDFEVSIVRVKARRKWKTTQRFYHIIFLATFPICRLSTMLQRIVIQLLGACGLRQHSESTLMKPPK
mmetsp:Transcript_54815/g.164052  ORF Transcript_54815/g.164052 Transcript_54815/m.164052 type:complete len:213 (-) Transcript_54815:768-1406(-)